MPPLVNARPSVGGPFESGAIVSEASLIMDGDRLQISDDGDPVDPPPPGSPTHIPIRPGAEGDLELGRVRVTEGAPIRVSCSFAFRRCQVM